MKRAKPILHVAAFALAILLVAGGPTAAGTLPDSAYAEVNEKLVEGYVLPRVKNLATRFAALQSEADRFCAAPSTAGMDALVGRFHAAMDAWMAVRHLRFGPLVLFMRATRIQYAPDQDGRVAAAIEEMLKARNSAALAPDSFRQASVAAQGFPALERLLFGVKAREALIAKGREADYRCRLVAAIASNLRRMGDGIVAGWTAGEPKSFIRFLMSPGPNNPYYATHRDATLDFFKSLYGGLQTIVDVELGPVLGQSLAEARPELAESQLSRRSLRNIALSLESLGALYGEDGGGLAALLRQSEADSALVTLLPKAFDMTVASARAVGTDLDAAVADPGRRKAVETLQLRARALKQLVSRRLAPAIGLAVGFNALDGD